MHQSERTHSNVFLGREPQRVNNKASVNGAVITARESRSLETRFLRPHSPHLHSLLPFVAADRSGNAPKNVAEAFSTLVLRAHLPVSTFLFPIF